MAKAEVMTFFGGGIMNKLKVWVRLEISQDEVFELLSLNMLR